jgi:hypothetical protein
VVFKFPQANCFWANSDKIWQFWAVLNRFSYYGNGSQHALI